MATGERDQQDAAFTGEEADRWFERNREHLVASRDDAILRLLEVYRVAPSSVLEIGAANGFRLAALAERYGCRAVAVEPSASAVADGRRRYPAVEFQQRTIASTGLTEQFDIVIVNFVLHWVSRQALPAAIGEVDRLVREGGLLCLGDFLPRSPTRRPYRHRTDVPLYTYKEDYSSRFTEKGRYEVIALLTGHYYAGPRVVVSEDDRAGTWLLRKSVSSG